MKVSNFWGSLGNTEGEINAFVGTTRNKFLVLCGSEVMSKDLGFYEISYRILA